MDKNDKIAMLKIKNRRKIIANELSKYLEKISFESFISVEKTIELTDQIYKKIDNTLNQEQLPKEINIVNQLKLIEPKVQLLLDNDIILFHYQDRETGALKLKLKEFFDSSYFLLSFIKFLEGYRDLILIDENLKFGICIERLEYYNKLIIWGIQS